MALGPGLFWFAVFRKQKIQSLWLFPRKRSICLWRNPDQERTNQNAWIYLKTILPYNNYQYSTFSSTWNLSTIQCEYSLFCLKIHEGRKQMKKHWQAASSPASLFTGLLTSALLGAPGKSPSLFVCILSHRFLSQRETGCSLSLQWPLWPFASFL